MFVKVCGITTEEDALLAVALGADAVGFIFAPSSRQVAVQRASEIARRLPPEILTVGVFRDESPERVVEIVHRAGLRGAQLHGHERPEHSTWVRARVPFVMKVFGAGDPALAEAADHGADAVMLDAATPGSGRVFDWTLAEGVPAGVRLVLAGGLHSGNVAEAIHRVHPWGVDAASGIEAAPGRKDARKLRAFLVAARAAAGPEHRAVDAAPYDWQDDA
jgi:phosphoribosylanthranilate isomerase